MDEAIKRFNLTERLPDPKRLFQECTSRTILQDHKLYVANSFSGGQTEKKEPIEGVSESVFDGNFSFSASRTNQPSNPSVMRKEPAAMMLARMPEAFAAISPFFELSSAFALTVERAEPPPANRNSIIASTPNPRCSRIFAKGESCSRSKTPNSMAVP